MVEWWAVALLVAMVLLVTVGVFFRYVVNASLSWYDEFASYLLVWLSFYGAVVATYRNRHIYFDAFLDRMAERTRRVFAIISELFSMIFQAILLVYGMVLLQAVAQETSASIQSVRMGWVYSVLPISGGLMLLVTLVRFVLLLQGRGDLPPLEARASGTISSE
ncbi:MAG TPA: TRAP transporter small permease [Methylomirabilota bacterium]|nr:TRAP transporter small permease [Methylomirabilota bacterium]